MGLQDGAVVVLVADDEDMLRNLVQEILEEHGYVVLTASDGERALSASRAYASDIDLLVSDIRMPQLSGIELATRILAERPGIRVLLTSGTTQPPSTQAPFLWKPFTLDEFITKIKEVLNGPPPVPADFLTSS